jgi:hypothetical protein
MNTTSMIAWQIKLVLGKILTSLNKKREVKRLREIKKGSSSGSTKSQLWLWYKLFFYVENSKVIMLIRRIYNRL